MKLSAVLAAKGSDVAIITPTSTVADLVQELSSRRIGALIVSVDGRSIVGIASERDVVRALASGPEGLLLTVADIMTSPVYCAPPDALVDELMHLMTERRIRHVPVTDPEGNVLGIVSIGDVVKVRLGELEGERTALMDYITRG